MNFYYDLCNEKEKGIGSKTYTSLCISAFLL